MPDDQVVVRTMTPQTRAVYEAGKKLLVDSIDVGREFCKFMITTSLGAIPVYISLLEFSGIKAAMQGLSFASQLLAWSPTLCFTIAAVIYMLGYFPQAGQLSLEIIEEIIEHRSRILLHQTRAIVIATIILISGILGSITTFIILP